MMFDDIDSVIRRTLAWDQCSDEQRSTLTRAASQTAEAYIRTDRDTRMRWATSGMTLRASRVLDNLVDEMLADDAILAARSEAETIDALLTADRVRSFREVPSAPPFRFRSRRAGRGIEYRLIDEAACLRAWIAGDTVHDLASGALGWVADPEYRIEQMAEYLSTQAETFLPWTLGVAISWFNLRKPAGTADISVNIPNYLRLGVSSPIAAEMMRRGASRGLANDIARDYQSSGDESDPRERLARMTIRDWRTRFNPSASEFNELFRIARTRTSEVLRSVLAGDGASLLIRPRFVLGPDPIPCQLGYSTTKGATRPVLRIARRIIAELSAHDVSDVDALLQLGLPIDASLVVESNEPIVRLALARV